MKSTINCFIMLLLLCAAPVKLAAQQVDFKVYFVKGQVKKINPPKTYTLKKGDALHESDWVSISAGAQLVLICKNYNSLKLFKADTVKLSTLAAQCARPSNSYTVAYLRYVWDELKDNDVDAQNYMHNVGAVVRGEPQLKLNFNPDTINYSVGPLNLSWEGKDQVTVKFYTAPHLGKVVGLYHFYGDHLPLDSLFAKLNGAGVYYWSMSNTNESNQPRYYLRIWPQQAYQAAISDMIGQSVATDKAETAYMTGFILEKAGFTAEAIKYYRMACDLDQNNKIYRTSLTRFL